MHALTGRLCAGGAFAAVLFCSTVASAAPLSCIEKVYEFNKQRNQNRWARFVHGLQNNFSRTLIANTDNDAMIAKQAFSCKLVAFALDRLMTGAAQNPTTTFTPAAFNTAVDDAVAHHQATAFHFKIPGEVKIYKTGNDNLGHHFIVEISFDGANPGAYVYMAFEDQYKLKSWLKDKYQPKGALGTGRRWLTVAEIKDWGRRLDELVAKLKLAAGSEASVPMRKQASTAASGLFHTLFGVSWEDMEMDPDHLIGADPAQIKVLFSHAHYDPANCNTTIDQLLQQAARTCNGELCS
jgi:hypothetical protein